ncbi:MAG: DUF1573 domain-containing protein [Bacteroidia bacterium]|nr:DUF1573 domain-containing protein [Bacteroidia bacterium]
MFKIFRNPSAFHGGIFYFRTIILMMFLFCALNSFSQPQLTLTENKKNFGHVQRGTVVKNDYEITNTGNSPLVINDVEIACSCTTVDYPKQPILPGQKTTVTVTFNTTTVYGRQDRIVWLNSNDPKGPHSLRYKGSVSKK